MVTVLRSDKTKDPFLAACARNIWYCAATYDIDASYAHIQGTDNKATDLLSRGTGNAKESLLMHVQDPWWLIVNEDMLAFHPDL